MPGRTVDIAVAGSKDAPLLLDEHCGLILPLRRKSDACPVSVRHPVRARYVVCLYYYHGCAASGQSDGIAVCKGGASATSGRLHTLEGPVCSEWRGSRPNIPADLSESNP